MGRKNPILAALNYYASPFFATIGQVPNRKTKSQQEQDQGNLRGFLMGRPFLKPILLI